MLKDIKTPQELFSVLQEKVHYGFVADDKVFNNYETLGTDMDKHWKSATSDTVIEQGFGVCWDVAEIMRDFCEQNNIKNNTYFIQSINDKNEYGRTHTFVLYEDNGKCNWIEHSWHEQRGIHEYKNQFEALQDIASKHMKFDENTVSYNLLRYSKPEKESTVSDFFQHIYTKGKQINLDEMTNQNLIGER